MIFGRKSNKAFSEKMVAEGLEILRACGFEDDDECMQIRAPVADGWLCAQAVKYIDLIVSGL